MHFLDMTENPSDTSGLELKQWCEKIYLQNRPDIEKNKYI